MFVYGTLRPGEQGFEELGLAARVDMLGMDSISGTLFDLGDYPGAVLNGDGTITGAMLMPRDEGVMALLDEFELFTPDDPAGSEYLRVWTVTDGGITVWIYVYNFSLAGAVVIASGDWTDRDSGALSNG